MTDRLDVLKARLRERGATLPCPACGNDAWEGSREFGLIVGATGETLPGEIDPSGAALETVMDICLHCGFVRQHLAFILERGQD